MVEMSEIQQKSLWNGMRSCFFFWIAFQLVMIPGIGVAAETQGDSFEKANQLIVMIKVKFGEIETFGAGIILGRDKHKLYIATADHFVRMKNRTAKDISVILKTHPDVELNALILNSHDLKEDVALLSVETLQEKEINPCALSFTVMGNSSLLKRGSSVFPVGYPTGIPWGSPFDPDRVSQVLGEKVTFQSRFIAPGHSGGALLNENGEIVGMILADKPPLGLALGIEKLLKVIGGWNYPVHLSSPVPDGGSALHKAAKADNVAEIRKLMKRPCADINIVDINGKKPLHSATAAGSFNATKLLLAHGASINSKNIEGDTPLHVAAAHGQLAIIQFLLEQGGNIKLQNSRGKTPLQVAFNAKQKEATLLLLKVGNTLPSSSLSPALILAVREEWMEVVNILIANGANFNWTNKDHKTLLYHAVQKENEKLVKILLKAGANPDEFSGPMRNTPLGIAACMIAMVQNSSCKGSEAIALILLKAGSQTMGSGYGVEGRRALLDVAVIKGWASVTKYLLEDGINPDGNLSQNLPIAIDKGHKDVLELLLGAGADPDGSLHKVPAIMQAIKKGRLEMVLPLVRAGANLWVRNNKGKTVYDLAFQLDDPELKELLVKASQVEVQLENVDNPRWPKPELHSLIRAGKVKEVARLLESGLNPNLREREKNGPLEFYGSDGKPALFVARSPKMIDLLIEAGANVNARYYGQTPLMSHLTSGTDPIILKTLLKHKALVNARFGSFMTPLHKAVEAKLWSLVEVLLEAGADPCAKRRWGETPFSIASKLDKADIFRSFFKKKNKMKTLSRCK